MKSGSKFDKFDEKYNFENCVRQKTVDSQACTTPWDQRPTDKLATCSKRSSMKAFESNYNQVFYSSEEELKDLTGCLLPCTTYTHYTFSDSYSLVSDESTFSIHFALTDLITKEEVLLLSFDSLVSEFGGSWALSGLLNEKFSCLGALSMMQIWVRSILSRVKTNKHEIGYLPK